jgi:transposase
VVDTQGLILHVLVHPADVHDRRASEAVLNGLSRRYPDVAGLFADMGYQGLASWLWAELWWTRLIVKRPRRWIVIARTMVPTAALTGLSSWTAVTCVRRDARTGVVAG